MITRPSKPSMRSVDAAVNTRKAATEQTNVGLANVCFFPDAV